METGHDDEDRKRTVSTTTDAPSIASAPSSSSHNDNKCEHLATRFDMHGWRPDPSLGDDENYMDIVLLLTRHSECIQGGMACILVDPSLPPRSTERKEPATSEVSGGGDPRRGGAGGGDDDDDAERTARRLEERLNGAIVAASTNASLFRKMDSDVHAEVGALGRACKRGRATGGCTAYVTMPPCKRCFASLVVSGIGRIVSRRAPPKVIADAAKEHGVEFVDLSAQAKEQSDRIDALTTRSNSAGGVGSDGLSSEKQRALVAERRRRRKEEKNARKLKSLAKRQRSMKTADD